MNFFGKIFSTVHKSGGQLFLLVTDQGFLEKSSLVWETLANIEGDTEFVNAQFQPGEEGLDQGEEGDRALALALGRQEEQGRDREQVNFFFCKNSPNSASFCFHASVVRNGRNTKVNWEGVRS